MSLIDDPKPRNGTQVQNKGPVRILLVVCGTLCVTLGILGMILPLLPTTPFLLLAAFCYSRSSKRFYNWLMTNRWCGKYIRNYRQGKGISLKQKLLTILLLWLTIGYAAGFVVRLWWVKIILLGIAIGVTTHLIRIKTFKPGPKDPEAKEKKAFHADRSRKTYT